MNNPGPCACTTLRRATRAVTALYDAALSPMRLRITQFSVLRILERRGPLTISALAAAAALDRSTMGRNLEPLRRRRLVKLLSGEDQRERVVGLTRAGRGVIRQALPHWEKVQTQVRSVIAAGSIDRLAARVESLSSS
jgi:DNA-binding MarR family transcriptional regulator